MKNYTTQTAALKATTVDTRILDTKVLKINGEKFEQSSIKSITTTIGSGNYNNSLTCWWGISTDALGINDYEWSPISLYINGQEVVCSKVSNSRGTWDFEIFGQLEDDFSEIYGGIDDNTEVKIIYFS